jgi:hypothetical protein
MQHEWLDELVCRACHVRRCEGCVDRCCRRTGAGAADHRAIPLLGARPTVIAVHAEVASAQRREYSAPRILRNLLLQFGEETAARVRRRVTSVQHAMDGHRADALAIREIEQREQMRIERVHAAVAEQSDEMQRDSARRSVATGGDERSVAEEGAGFDRGTDAHQVLLHHATGTKVHVADLAVPHLTLRQADTPPTRFQQRAGHRTHQVIPVWRLGEGDCVRGGVLAVPPTIENHEADRPNGVRGHGWRVGRGSNVVAMTSAECTPHRWTRPSTASHFVAAYTLVGLVFLACGGAMKAQKPADSTGTKVLSPATIPLRPATKAEIRAAPDGALIGTVVVPGTILPMARERGWVRVRMEGWIRESDLLPVDSSLRTTLSAADLRADPDGSKGKLVRWKVEILAFQRADALRRDLNTGEPYLLARGPAGENAMLYLALPSALVNEAKAIVPLTIVQITARVRTGRSAPTNVPILDVEAITPP